jgi:hypothetical protein
MSSKQTNSWRNNSIILWTLVGFSIIVFVYGGVSGQEANLTDCSKVDKNAVIIKTFTGDLTCKQYIDSETKIEYFSFGLGIISSSILGWYSISMFRERKKFNDI